MISVSEARSIMLGHVERGAIERVALADALGRTLAEPITARRAQPPFRASAMDGYAVRSRDTPGVLRVIGESGAGRALAHELQTGECARIFTGAPLPDGADAVLIQEDARREADSVTAPHVALNRHVREVGVDFAEGARLLEPPLLLGGAELALIAAAGQADAGVAARPRVLVMGGGDEIVSPGTEPGPAQIFDCASYGVAGLATSWGASARTSPPFPDRVEAIAQAIDEGLRKSDLVVVIGGASVGDHDHARAAIAKIGATHLFEKVALRPGKPTWFAVRDGKAVLGLPGNPTSAFVCARLFLRPVIDKMLGRDPEVPAATRFARLARPLEANGPRETYLRARTRCDDIGQVWVEAAPNQDSSLVSVFAISDALIVRAPGAAAANAGEIVPTLAI
jgi:molybdopterin molybdotransferase